MDGNIGPDLPTGPHGCRGIRIVFSVPGPARVPEFCQIGAAYLNLPMEHWPVEEGFPADLDWGGDWVDRGTGDAG